MQNHWLGDRYRRRQDPACSPNGVGDRDPVTMEDDEEEEVEIVSGVTSDSRSPSHKKRAFSLGTMDIDLPDIDMPSVKQHAPSFASTEGSERCSSPIDASSALSAYSDDEDMSASYSEARLGPLSTPSLSHTHPSSNNSSLVSLPLTHSSPNFDAQPDQSLSSPTSRNQPWSLHVPATASRSEKAIAALTLAIANGAGGLNDYEALMHLEGASAQDEFGVGELWH